MKGTVVIIACVVILTLYAYATLKSTRTDDDDRSAEYKSKFKTTIKSMHLDDRPDQLFWFLQISDIHVSIFHDDKRIDDFRSFVNETINTIKPPVVLASGDLTDARDSDFLGSHQHDGEWKIYHDILHKANIEKKTLWLDIRGNHDNFNVPLYRSEDTHYARYSIQGGKHKRSYMHLVKGTSGETYSFIAVDACLEPGPKRPFNFIGLLVQNDTDEIHHLIERAQIAESNYAIWFGHYPTSCILTINKQRQSLRRIISSYENSLAYMCGHLHTLGGIVPNMYALQEDSFLELELADWKKNRMYRLAAIDHGRLSFVDVKHKQWPVILIVNPKHALFHIPHRNESILQAESTHIRILAFSLDKITYCEVFIDGKRFADCQSSTENLFVVPWNPKEYMNGLHVIKVLVKDKSGREAKISHPFKMHEDKLLDFDFMARFVVLGDVATIFKYMFLSSLALCTLPLIFFRLWHTLVIAGILGRKRGTCRTSMSCLQKLWILSSIDRLFWPIIAFCIYLAVGPWSYCEVIDNHYGVIFVWGIYIDGTYLPGSLTYLYGFFQLFLCHFPLIWIYSKCTEARYFEVVGMPRKKHRGSIFSLRNLSHAPFYVIIGIEIMLAISFGFWYGTVAFLCGPFRSWSVILNAGLWYMARNVPVHCFRSAIYVWSGHNGNENRTNDTTNQETTPTTD